MSSAIYLAALTTNSASSASLKWLIEKVVLLWNITPLLGPAERMLSQAAKHRVTGGMKHRQFEYSLNGRMLRIG